MNITKNTTKEEILKISTICKGCGHCCSYGVGFVLDDEIESIAKHLNIKKEELVSQYLEKIQIFNKNLHKPKYEKPFGKCIFLEDNKCKIHCVKPLHCKVGNCNNKGEMLIEWFYSNNLVDYDDPQSIREWHTRTELKNTIKGASPKEIIGEKLLDKIIKYEIFTTDDLKNIKDQTQNKNDGL